MGNNMSIAPGSLRNVCDAFSRENKEEESSVHETCDDSGYESASSSSSEIITVKLRTSGSEFETTVTRSSDVHATVKTELDLTHDVSIVFCGDCVEQGITFDELGCEEGAVFHVADLLVTLPRHLEQLLARITSEGVELAEVVANRLSKEELAVLASHIEATGQES